jgi:hypothetical protein
MSNSLGFANKVHKIDLKHMKSAVTKTMICGPVLTQSNINLQCDITLPSNADNREYTSCDKHWRNITFSLYIITSIGLLIYSYINYTVQKSYIFPSLTAVAITIATVTWIRNMLSMNMFKRETRNRMRYSALLLYGLAGMCFISSSLGVMQQSSLIQFAASFVGSIVGWQAFLIIYEGDYRIPTAQQIGALVQILILSALWELRTYLVNMHFT